MHERNYESVDDTMPNDLEEILEHALIVFIVFLLLGFTFLAFGYPSFGVVVIFFGIFVVTVTIIVEILYET